MDKTLFAYIRRHSARQQIAMSAMAAASFPFLYLFYELPKLIINEAISAKTIIYPIRVASEFDLFGTAISIDTGLLLEQTGFLFTLCGFFLILVIINQSFKYVINVYKGLTGERMLRRLRYDLYARVLRFPLPTFRKISQGEIIPMITSEVEPLGGFIGDAYSLPAFQGGTLLTILGFLFYQDWRMASAAVALIPLQLYIIPRLQRRVNLLGKERVQRVRQLSERIGETVQGAQEVHAHDTSNYVLAGFAERLGGIFEVRYKIYRQKFVIKFLNNFIQQLGPFFFYSLGGLYVIQGELEIGTLVAAIAAHKDLAAPWKELLSYYQMQADANIKYDQVVSQFEPAGMMEESFQLDEPADTLALKGDLKAANVTLVNDQDVAVIDGVTVTLPLDQRIAIVGSGGSGKEELTLLLARLLSPDRGNIVIDGRDTQTMPEAVTGRRLSYVGANSFIFAGTISDNLFYGLKHRPLAPAADVEDWEQRRVENERSGNIAYDPNADWIDYQSAGAEGPEDLRRLGLNVLELMDLQEDVYQFGLRGTIDPVRSPELAERILSARRLLRERLAKDEELAALIETFDPEKYNDNASVGENLLFGNPVGDAFHVDRLAENDYVLATLADVGLTDDFLQIGYQVAATMVELFADLPPEHELFQQFSFISADDLPETQALLQRADKAHLDQLPQEDRTSLMSLPFRLIPARHRLGLVDEELQQNIMRARRAFAANLPEELKANVTFFEPETYNNAANLQDNILFGKVVYGQAQAVERVGALIGQLIEELDLKRVVAEVGLNFSVGIAGSRLSGEQRQKLALARAAIKRPDCLILAGVTASFDTASQARILEKLLTAHEGRSLIWAVQRTSMAEGFDSVLVMRQGRVVEFGTFAELNREGTHLNELLSSE